MNGQETEKCEKCKKMFDFDSDAAASSTICPSCMFDNAIAEARADERRKYEREVFDYLATLGIFEIGTIQESIFKNWDKSRCSIAILRTEIEKGKRERWICKKHSSAMDTCLFCAREAKEEAYAKGYKTAMGEQTRNIIKATQEGREMGQASLETGCKKHIAPSGSMVVCTACYNEEKENENPVRSKAFIEYIERKHSEEMRKRDAIILPKLDKLKPKQQLPLEYFEQLRIWWCHEARRQAYEDSMVQYKLTTSTLSAETGEGIHQRNGQASQ